MSGGHFARFQEDRKARHAIWEQARDLYGDRRIVAPSKGIPKAPRKVCVCCGKRYGQRAIEWKRQEFKRPETVPDPQRLANGYIIEGDIVPGVIDGEPGVAVSLRTWDGEAMMGGFDPFCTTTCALRFARAAYRAGYRTKGDQP